MGELKEILVKETGSGEFYPAKIYLFSAEEASDNLVCLELSLAERSYEARNENYFHALIEIRGELEAEGLIPQCYGASRNVYTSPMILDMGDARKAYKMKVGKQAPMVDLVDISIRMKAMNINLLQWRSRRNPIKIGSRAYEQTADRALPNG